MTTLEKKIKEIFKEPIRKLYKNHSRNVEDEEKHEEILRAFSRTLTAIDYLDISELLEMCIHTPHR